MLTDQQLHTFAQKEILFKNPAAASPDAYIPTLIIGLGGTGLKTLRFLKKHLRRNQAQDIVLLGIECDLAENEKYPELPKLDESEMAVMDSTEAARLLAQARQSPEEHRYVLDFLPQHTEGSANLHQEVDDAIRSRKGAAQFRRAGRAIFHANVDAGANLHGRFVKIRGDLRGLHQRQARQHKGIKVEDKTRILVVTSLAGGTGAGSLLDCLALLRLVFDAPTDEITTFCVLPGKILDRSLYTPHIEIPNTRGNAIGMLRELQALRLGLVKNYHFDFGRGLRYDPAGKNLVNGIYLVDNRLYDGTEPKDFMDICNAIGLFIYAFVGTGVGAEAASGQINSAIMGDGKVEKIPRCFQALGVAALAYPVDELEEYSLRYILDQWLARWFDRQTNAEWVAAEASTATSALGLDSTDAFAQLFRIEIPGSKFDASADRAHFLSVSDEQLFAEKDSSLDACRNSIKSYGRQIDGHATDIVARLCADLDQRALGWLGTTSEQAVSLLTQLQQVARQIKQAIIEEKDSREGQINTLLERDLPKREWWINLVDFGLDKGLREKYLNALGRLTQLEYEAAFQQETEEGIDQLISHIASLLNRASLASSGLARDQESIRKALAATDSIDASDTTQNEYGAVQQAMPFSAFRGWAESVSVDLPDAFSPPAFSKEALVDCVWRTMFPPFRDAVLRLDLIAQAMTEHGTGPSLSNRIRSLDDSAIPTMKLIDGAPRTNTMSPQKYVAGKAVRTDNQAILGWFRGTGQRQVTALSIASPHAVICTQTYQGFGAAHWGGFEEAFGYYAANPWRFHVLPNHDQLPPLAAMSDLEVATHRELGLALMCELIVEKSGGYFLNFASGKSEFAYLTYNKEPAPFAAKLVGEKLVHAVGDSAKFQPDAKNNLGASLDLALRRFSAAEMLRVQDDIRTLLDHARAKLGQSVVRADIEHFLAEHLGRKVCARPADKSLGDKIAETLRAYAASIA